MDRIIKWDWRVYETKEEALSMLDHFVIEGVEK